MRWAVGWDTASDWDKTYYRGIGILRAYGKTDGAGGGGVRVLFDMGHPAHVHFFKNTIWALQKHGHQVQVTARDKDVTIALLKAYDIPYELRGTGGASSFKKGLGLIKTDLKMLKIAGKFKPDVMCGILNPYTAQVSRLVGAKSITFTDTEHAKSARKMTLPFSKNIITPTAYHLDHGKKHLRYAGYHELAYLHPNRFRPDKMVLDELGISKNEKYAIVRFVSWHASHDIGYHGFSIDDKVNIINEIEKCAIPIITSEGEIPEKLRKYQLKIPPHRIHDALNYASLYVGEGATMASEAAVLGTPGIYTNDLKVGYVDEEEKFGLIKQFSPSSNNIQQIIETTTSFLEKSSNHWNELKENLLKIKIDVTAFMIWFLENYPESAITMKENPEFQNKFINMN